MVECAQITVRYNHYQFCKITISLRRILTPLKVRVCFRPAVTIKQLLSHPKDPTHELQRSGVVYRIPCSDCPASYIGQTKRRLHQRIEEHKRAVRQADFNSSALAEHAWNHSHPIDWSNIKVLSNPRDRYNHKASGRGSSNKKNRGHPQQGHWYPTYRV